MSTSNCLLYSKILNKFPKDHIKLAFAYGSGVFKQANNRNNSVKSSSPPSSLLDRPMIDFVFVVDDSQKFHAENLKLNSSHYSFLKWFGPGTISRIQNDMGAACYYNTLVPFRIVDEQNEEFHLIKYGLIGREAFERDLTNWDYLYMSGRMHKPVKIIKNNLDDSKLQTALNVNLSNALHTALLILPEKFKLVDLFICITSLSYMGDFRMVIGENKQKCSNIVLPQIDRFTQLYKSHIQNASAHLNCNFASGHLEQDRSLKSIQNNLKRLPSNLLFKMASAAAIKLDNRDEIERSLENERKDHGELVSQAINSVVKQTSLTQTIKGLLTAGVYKSVVYASRKLKKMLN